MRSARRGALRFVLARITSRRISKRPEFEEALFCSAARVGPKSAYRFRTRVRILCSNEVSSLRFDARPRNP